MDAKPGDVVRARPQNWENADEDDDTSPIEGVAQMKPVKTPFGNYDQWTVTLPDGAWRQIDPDTIQVVKKVEEK